MISMKKNFSLTRGDLGRLFLIFLEAAFVYLAVHLAELPFGSGFGNALPGALSAAFSAVVAALANPARLPDPADFPKEELP